MRNLPSVWRRELWAGGVVAAQREVGVMDERGFFRDAQAGQNALDAAKRGKAEAESEPPPKKKPVPEFAMVQIPGLA